MQESIKKHYIIHATSKYIHSYTIQKLPSDRQKNRFKCNKNSVVFKHIITRGKIRKQ